jgi:hypothetical protein
MCDWYSAVFVGAGGPESQAEFLGACLTSAKSAAFAETKDERFVVLSHPCEDEILQRTGYTWKDLLWQGRYVSVTNVICRCCGTIFPTRRLGVPASVGCGASLCIGACIGAVTGLTIWAVTQNFLWGFGGWYVSTLLMAMIAEKGALALARWRFADRDRLLRAESHCPACKSDSRATIDSAEEVICPQCHTTSLTFSMVGIS